MPIRNHTGIIPWRLNGSGGGGFLQPIVAGQPNSFVMSTLPAVTAGKLCNYLLGIVITLTGRILVATPEGGEAPGSAAGRLAWRTQWDIIRSIFASVEVNGAWHGTALSSQHVKGEFLQLIEFMANGLERPYRQKPPIGVPVEPEPAARYFRFNFFIPLCLLAGEKGHHTALPCAMYKNAELVLNARPLLSGPWESDTLSELYVKASALMLPEDEVRLGPSIQWIDYQQKVAGEAISLNNLGVVSTHDNVDKGAGIVGAFWLSNRNGLPGPGQVRDITDITIPFRDIIHTAHTDPVVNQLEAVAGNVYQPQGELTDADGDGSDAPSGDMAGFPYDDFDYGVSENGTTNATAALPNNPVVLALCCPSKRVELSKVQAVEGTQEIQLQHRAGTPAVDSGTHHVLALQVHSWNPQAFASAKQRLIEAGVTRAVLGTDDCDWSVKTLKKQDPTGVNPRKLRFFPMRLVATEGARAKVP
jgi:hypothetical protein